MDKGIQSFPLDIILKVNVIARLVFDVAVQHVNH